MLNGKDNNTWIRLIVFNIFVFILFGCGSVTKTTDVPAPSSGQAVAPIELNNSRITLSVTTASPLSNPYISTGNITTYFSESRFVEDATDSGLDKFYGTYTIVSAAEGQRNRLVVDQHNQYNVVRTTFTFTDATSGTFIREYYEVAGSVITQTQGGNFFLTSEPFNILPSSLTDYIFKLNLMEAESSLHALQFPAANKSFDLKFLAHGRVNFVLPEIGVAWDATYAMAVVDKFNLVIKGVDETTRHPYQLKLTFDTFNSGAVTLNVDNGKAAARGRFSTSLQHVVERSALKGQVIHKTEITSANTRITYPYTVYLPPGYSASGKKYPVMYSVDGQWVEDLPYILEKKSKEVILILIHQGPANRRMTDYTPVGAANYIKFLKQELAPLIESTYTTNFERTYFGSSIGGLLGAILLADEPVGKPFFKNYILGDGTFWWYTADLYQAEQQRYNNSAALPVNLFLSTSPQGNPGAVEAFAKRYRERYQGLNIAMKVYPVPHENVAGLTFTDAIDVLF